MAWQYERPYTTARGAPSNYTRWEDEARPQGSGRRALHWRHLESHIVFGDRGIDHQAKAPDQALAERRKRELRRAADPDPSASVLDTSHLREAEQRTRRKFLEPRVQASSIKPYGVIQINQPDRPTKRFGWKPDDALDADYRPRASTPTPGSQRRVRVGAVYDPDTNRVLDTDLRDPEHRPRGMRCSPPRDALMPTFTGERDAPVDRGLRCHYDVPQTLSFKP